MNKIMNNDGVWVGGWVRGVMYKVPFVVQYVGRDFF